MAERRSSNTSDNSSYGGGGGAGSSGNSGVDVYSSSSAPRSVPKVWHACPYCTNPAYFNITRVYVSHVQRRHCTQIDVSQSSNGPIVHKFVCHCGPNGTCSAIAQGTANANEPEPTFELHVRRHHLNTIAAETTAENLSIFTFTQNLPAVLNDPSRGKQSTLFTKKWGDGFVEKTHIAPSPHLAEVTYDDLEAYMQRIGKRYRRHQRLQQIACSNSTTDRQQQAYHTEADESISDIPAIFLQQNLQLNEPAIFAQVFAGLESRPKRRPNDDLESEDDESTTTVAERNAAAALAATAGSAARLQLQERLSHYLDIVEVHITRKVSQQSGAFFAAMTSQHTIMAEMHAAMLNVRQLRQQIASADATLVRSALRICAARRRQQNHVQIVHKLRIMAEVHKTQPMIQLLLGTADYVAAIDLIGSTQELLVRELRDVHCFKHLPSQLNEMERLIDKMLRTEFERFATVDLNRRDDGNGSDDDATSMASTLGTATNPGAVNDEEKLVSIVWGLLRQRNFAFIDTYRDEAIVTVRAHIKEMLIEVLASSDTECSLTGTGEQSQSLSIGEWIELLDRATVRLLRLLRRICAVIGVMLRIVAQSAGQPAVAEDVGFYRADAFLAADERRRVDERLAELMHTVCNYCHERCATLISSQSLERNVATASQIERLERIVSAFSTGCETLAAGCVSPTVAAGAAQQSSVCLPLLAALNTQATRFAQKFHADRKAKLSLLLDSERWRQIEVPAELQRLVDAVAAGQWTIEQPQTQTTTISTQNQDKHSLITTTSPALRVDGETFVLVGSALILLQIIDEYARCAVQLPVIAAPLARHVVDLLRTFNSRCCQLVLGAGALRVAGLKTITSANLALVARALQLVVWLLPHIREHFQRAADGPTSATVESESPAQTTILNGNGAIHNSHPAQPSNSTAGYDIVERDLLSHIAEIDTMILSIVTQVVTTQMDGWTARPPVPSASFRSISRHFVKLHEAVAPIMPADQVARIYGLVHRTFKDKLREQLGRHGVVNNGGPAHGVVTAELTFYTETLRTLGVMAEAELADAALADVWRK